MATSAARSLFTRVFVGDGRRDLYNCCIRCLPRSFGEGIYTGKGFTTDTINVVLGNGFPAMPSSAMILEVALPPGRLTTDIALIDGYPSRYDAYALPPLGEG